MSRSRSVYSLHKPSPMTKNSCTTKVDRDLFPSRRLYRARGRARCYISAALRAMFVPSCSESTIHLRPAGFTLHNLAVSSIVALSLTSLTTFAQNVERISKREIERRQAALPRGEEALIRAKAAMKERNFAGAHEEFRVAVTFLPDAVVSARSHDEAVDGF